MSLFPTDVQILWKPIKTAKKNKKPKLMPKEEEDSKANKAEIV